MAESSTGKALFKFSGDYFACDLTDFLILFSIDATSESGRLGRLVNHSRLNPNLQTKVVTFKQQPRLILVARRDIAADEELLYDYGDRSKESLKAHPWLAS